jgi:DNA-nicking Smr family endonuclease
MARKKKPIPDLGEENLYVSFGVEPEKSPGFDKRLEENLAGQDMRAILKEKAGPDRAPLTDREKLQVYPPPQEELDLHGKTGAEAERATAAFIATASSLQLKTVRIITGKGLHSAGPAVLPDVVASKLQELKDANLIFTFTWEKGEKHKSGAVIVYLY